MNLYKWKADKLNNTGLIQQVAVCEIHHPISERNFTATATLIASCLANTSAVMHAEAPYARDNMTPVYLGATAGMRLTNMSEPTRTAAIFRNLTRLISVGYQAGRISIIDGCDEGLFAWIGVNYIKRTYFPGMSFSATTESGDTPTPTPTTYGILDMGGASAQIAHQIDGRGRPDEDQTMVRLYGLNYTVTTYSNLCFGAEQAIAR